MTHTILKVPFDLGILDEERRGTSKAPDILAKEIKKSFPKIKNIKLSPQEDFSAMQESIRAAAVSEYKKDNEVVALGGDHSITFGLVQAFAETHSNFCLIILDAHTDCEDDFIPPSHEGVIRALATTCVPPENILLIGPRKFRTKEEIEFIQKHTLKYIESKDINETSIKKILDFLKSFDAAYLSIDIDIFDPKDAPETSWPEHGGPPKKVLFELISALKKTNKIKSYDLVEVSPSKKTCKMVATATGLLKEILK